MPRPKKGKIRVTSFSAPPSALRAKDREDVKYALGLSAEKDNEIAIINDIYSQIEKMLGFYKKASLISANSPGIADYKHELSSFERDISAYRKKLQRYPDWIRDSIDEHGGNLDLVEKTLANLGGASATAVSTYARKESRGRKTDQPRLELIKKSQMLFTKYSVKGKRKTTIAKVKLERKYAEEDFVKIVLKAAGITVPKTLRRILRRR